MTCACAFPGDGRRFQCANERKRWLCACLCHGVAEWKRIADVNRGSDDVTLDQALDSILNECKEYK